MIQLVGNFNLGSERVAIKQQMSVTPPITRCTSYTFKKIPELRGAEYQGSWMHGKLHGQGTLKWPGKQLPKCPTKYLQDCFI